ncbi:MAG: sodium/proton-translocating pyrophosphatase [bacterium]|nr:sodium/proton-translocating pyrophosphatase [bacterium]
MDIQLVALTFAPATAIIALLYGFYLTKKILRKEEGSSEIKKIGQAISMGAMTYLKRQFKVTSVFTLILAIIITFTLGWGVALTFLLGAIFSAAAGFGGMWLAVRANTRTANYSQKGLNPALQIAFGAGTVNGMLIVGLGLLGVSLIYTASYFLKIGEGAESVNKLATDVLIGYGFGACLLALFIRVGGGIYTKAAVVGDTVGDPLKDTAGPALNPMIKIINIVALMAAPLIVLYFGQ